MKRAPKKPPSERISRPAYIVFKLSITVSCLMLAGSLLISVYAGGTTAYTARLMLLRSDLYSAPQGILLAGSLGALYIDSAIRDRR